MPFDLELTDPTVRRLGITLLLLVSVFVLTRIGQHLIARYVEDPERQYRTSKFMSRTGGLLALLGVIAVWSPGTHTALTVLTVIGAGLAISMREALLSMIGWINLVTRAPYRQGDRIEINDVRGDVVDIRLLHSTLMEIGGWVDADQSTGRLVHIPNSWVYQYGIYNYTRGFGFIWNELSVTLTFRSDWQAAREIMLSLGQESADIVERQATREIRQLSREYLIHYSILTPFVYVRIGRNGIRLTLRYLCEARKRRGTEHALTISLLREFQQNGRIELAHEMMGVVPFDTPQFEPLGGNGKTHGTSETPSPEGVDASGRGAGTASK